MQKYNKKLKELINLMFLDLQITLIQIKKIATLATKPQLKTELDKIEKLQPYDSSIFLVKVTVAVMDHKTS